MTKYFAAYFATLVLMLVLDLLWLGVIAKPLYQQGIGHLMAEHPRVAVALAFYLLYPVGLVWFGFFAYATYDLTNLATLRDWPVSLAALDTAWGTAVSAVCAAAGRLALEAVSTA